MFLCHSLVFNDMVSLKDFFHSESSFVMFDWHSSPSKTKQMITCRRKWQRCKAIYQQTKAALGISKVTLGCLINMMCHRYIQIILPFFLYSPSHIGALFNISLSSAVNHLHCLFAGFVCNFLLFSRGQTLYHRSMFPVFAYLCPFSCLTSSNQQESDRIFHRQSDSPLLESIRTVNLLLYLAYPQDRKPLQWDLDSQLRGLSSWSFHSCAMYLSTLSCIRMRIWSPCRSWRQARDLSSRSLTVRWLLPRRWWLQWAQPAGS